MTLTKRELKTINHYWNKRSIKRRILDLFFNVTKKRLIQRYDIAKDIKELGL